ncbi:MAG: hypothetical protein BGO52_03460 [Sphingobacteriales bacterium 44-61]|nr:MAG: hypothetical protein BGO52_03460 [Sphingobacteriales bacterium 44-61]
MIFFYKKRFTGDHKKRIITFEILLFAYFLLSHITFFITIPYSTLYLSSIWLIGTLFFFLTIKPLTKAANTSRNPATEEHIIY